MYGFVASAGGSIGLLVGGVLTQAINWHWIFFVNVPIGIVTGAFALRVLDSDRGIGLGRGADLPGALLITGSLMLGVYTIVKPAAEHGWGAARHAGAGGRVARAARRVRRPRGDGATPADAAAHLPLAQPVAAPTRSRRCRGRACSGCSSSARCTCSGCSHYDALEIGLAFLPATVVMGTLSLRYSERLITRFGRATDPACPAWS